ncbi:MAG: HAMP domain-containing sensor histidine kinase, partial [Acidimicrobiia bacterium]|nr:HAMP domain-containing sensor histidine kinase [Acidimicrobiia bacterium]
LPVRLEKDDVALLLTDVLEQIRPLFQNRRLDVVHAIEDGLPAVRADRTRVLQVLWNLLGNAAKFTPDGGTVTVGAETRGDFIRVFVRDSGPGIAPEDQDHVFDRFWQVRRSDREGVGLGLAIVKGIVEAHGGEVGVTSTLGHGSTFWFTLPVWREEGTAPGSDESLVVPGALPGPRTERVPAPSAEL